MTLYFDCRCLELCPAVVAGKTCNERWSDGCVNGRLGALYAQFQLLYWDGVSRGCIWPFNHHGEKIYSAGSNFNSDVYVRYKITWKSLYRRGRWLSQFIVKLNLNVITSTKWLVLMDIFGSSVFVLFLVKDAEL